MKNQTFSAFLPNLQKDISDDELLQTINLLTFSHNKDNISRTKAYFKFYQLHPNIKWSFLASMVSRNAGYNMCDLKGKWYPSIISPALLKRLYLTYERGNWIIFQDAFPQLLLYHYSVSFNRSLFHLCSKLHISLFMQKVWQTYWKTNDGDYLMQSQIINEQNTIEQPLIEHPTYQSKIFHTLLFKMQELSHYSCVIFPTLQGELYGASVKNFKKVTKRILLGNQLVAILFHEHLYPYFYAFACKVEHTGSRFDYEKYLSDRKEKDTPILRLAYPIIEHHNARHIDWSSERKIEERWYDRGNLFKEPIHLTEWFNKKQTTLRKWIATKKIWLDS